MTSRIKDEVGLAPAKETGLNEDAFPATCPYDWNEIVAREFSI